MDDDRVGRESSVEGMTIGQFIREQCPFYLSIGVTWDEYWNGDYSKLPYFRKAYNLKQKQDNAKLWLQGYYFLHAIGAAFSKEGKYPEEPIPLTEEDVEAQEAKRKQIEIDNARAYMEVAMHNINKKRREQQGGEQSG